MQVQDIEFGHIYTDENNFLEANKSLETLSYVLNNKKDMANIKFSILIDNYYKESVLDCKKYKKFLKMKLKKDFLANKKNILIKYEASFANNAKMLIEKLKKDNKIHVEYFKKENKYVEFYKNENLKDKIALCSYKNINNCQNDIKYSCIILTVAWYLYRMKYFEGKIDENISLTQILHTKFQRNETKVVHLLRNEFNIHNNIEYIWC